jgi:hypothetical protein
MAHDLDGGDVAGEDDDAAFAFPDPGLDVLQSVANVRLLLHSLLDALVQLKKMFLNTVHLLVLKA